jgi:hypothetical protein
LFDCITPILSRPATSPIPVADPLADETALSTGWPVAVVSKRWGVVPPERHHLRCARAVERGVHQRHGNTDVQTVHDAPTGEGRRDQQVQVHGHLDLDQVVLEYRVTEAVGRGHIHVAEGEVEIVEPETPDALEMLTGDVDPDEKASSAQRLGPLGEDGARRRRGLHGDPALEPVGDAARRRADRDVRDGLADRSLDERDDPSRSGSLRRDEVPAMGAEGAREAQRLAAGPEGEQPDDLVAQVLGAKRRVEQERGGGERLDRTSDHSASG